MPAVCRECHSPHRSKGSARSLLSLEPGPPVSRQDACHQFLPWLLWAVLVEAPDFDYLTVESCLNGTRCQIMHI